MKLLADLDLLVKVKQTYNYFYNINMYSKHKFTIVNFHCHIIYILRILVLKCYLDFDEVFSNFKLNIFVNHKPSVKHRVRFLFIWREENNFLERVSTKIV